MGGSWLSLIFGFAGVALTTDHQLRLDPRLPENWTSLRFQLQFRGRKLAFTVTQSALTCRLIAGKPLTIYLQHEPILITNESISHRFL
ncbi:glycosyl hydrolase family 65 protein [Secundilactobacillus muriivasis]